MRNTTITIVKALAIILVVMAHSCCPSYLSRFSYMLCVSLFFMASGYCFNTKYLDDEYTFIRHRFSSLYVPFVKWSIFFIVLNHIWFKIGFLSEQYGNAAGGVTHPLSLHGGMQALWSIVCNMSGYDSFLTGAYWFFRAMLISSIVFLFAFKVIAKLRQKISYTSVAMIVGVLALGLATWKTECRLSATGVAQGGYRELMGIFLLAVGYVYSQFERWLAGPISIPVCFNVEKYSSIGRKRLARSGNAVVKCAYTAVRFLGRVPVASMAVSAIALGLITAFTAPAMTYNAKNTGAIFLLALSAIIGFSFIKNAAFYLNKIGNAEEHQASEATHPFRRAILFLGENTLYVFGWHLLAFKFVSMLKVGVYGLPWGMVGGHPVVHSDQGHWFWILYTLVGVAAPLLCVIGIRRVAKIYSVEELKRDLATASRNVWELLKNAGKALGKCAAVAFSFFCKGIIILGQYIWRIIKWIVIGIWKSIYGFIQTFIDTVKEASDYKKDE